VPLDLKAMLRDKRLLAGVGVAGALGLYVLYRRKAGGGSSSTTSGTAGAGGAVGYPNTSGTDIASWLGNYSQSLQSQLDAFSAQPKSTLIQVSGGTKIDDFLAQLGGTSWDQLLALNPGLDSAIAQSNNYGYLSPTNPGGQAGAGPTVRSFGGSRLVRIPLPAAP
jgi:hypothetical protein